MAVSDAPQEQTRADLRRAQVLAAAAKCFNRDGFHSASMASIAAEAALSVGQIYRYFENKEAVIAAIVEQSLEDSARRMAEVRTRTGGDLVEEMIEVARFHAEKVGAADRAALSLEFLAEAARNPRIGELVRVVDLAVRARLRDLLQRGGGGDENLEARLDMISLLIDGWAVRAVKNPILDTEAYLNTLRPLFELLLGKAGASCSA